jgi:hypothetical protein
VTGFIFNINRMCFTVAINELGGVVKQEKNVINLLIGSWLLFIAVDSVIAIFKLWRLKKPNGISRFFDTLLSFVRGIVVFFIAVLNFFMIAKLLDVKQS